MEYINAITYAHTHIRTYIQAITYTYTYMHTYIHTHTFIHIQPYPDGVDPTRREMYLSDEDFRNTFNCTKNDFVDMPQWKREVCCTSQGPIMCI